MGMAEVEREPELERGTGAEEVEREEILMERLDLSSSEEEMPGPVPLEQAGMEVPEEDGGDGGTEEAADDSRESESQETENDGNESENGAMMRRRSCSPRDLHGFELRKEQVEAYNKFEPLLREEERERRCRWTRFAETDAHSSADVSSSQSEQGSNDRGSNCLDLDNNRLVASVKHVLGIATESQNGSDYGNAESMVRELRMLVQNGVPSAVRGSLWHIFLEKTSDPDGNDSDACSSPGSRPLASPTLSPLDHYKELSSETYHGAQNGEGGFDEDPSLAYVKLIDKDIPRTLPGHKRARFFIETGALKRILISYCRHHPDVGYCQGMNFVAGILLIIMEQDEARVWRNNANPKHDQIDELETSEDGESESKEANEDLLLLESAAFWCLDSVCGKLLSRYYSADMVELQVDQLVMQQLLEEKFPTVASALDRLGVSLACVSSSWLLCAFANALPWTTLLRTWDVLLFPLSEDRGRNLLIKMTLALVDIHAKSLIACSDATQLIIMLQSMAVQSFDSSQLVTITCMGFPDLDDTKLEETRLMYRPIVIATFSKNQPGINQTDQEDPEVNIVRDRLGLKRIDEHTPRAQTERPIDTPDNAMGDIPGSDIDDGDGAVTPLTTARSNLSTARSAKSNASSAAMLRKRLLGSSSGILSPFAHSSTPKTHVRRAVSLQQGVLQAPGGGNVDAPNTNPDVAQKDEQIMQLNSVRYYLEKQVVDLIGIIARMNKELKQQDHQRVSLETAEQQIVSLTGSLEAVKMEMNKKMEELEAKDDLIKMLQEKIMKQTKPAQDQQASSNSRFKQLKESASNLFRTQSRELTQSEAVATSSEASETKKVEAEQCTKSADINET